MVVFLLFFFLQVYITGVTSGYEIISMQIFIVKSDLAD